MVRSSPRRARRSVLRGGVSALALALAMPRGPALAQQAALTQAPVESPQSPGADEGQDIIVTGSTSKRSLLSESVNVTLISEQDLLLKAPRTTVDILEQVPGVFVEGTAGETSNNYSVRGLPGGGQQFITFEEDGLPIVYQGGGADEYFQYDQTIQRVEAVEGGTSGILAVNGAGATINFISRPLSFDKPTGLVKFSGATYGLARADFWLSAPIPDVDGLAFSLGGFVETEHGQRDNPFGYQSYQVKAMLEKKLDAGGWVRLMLKAYNDHFPYYADQPYRYSAGDFRGVPGLNPQFGNILGNGFGAIALPDSPATGTAFRLFKATDAINLTGEQVRFDWDIPITDTLETFGKTRYFDAAFDFNGIFPGSGSGNAGLTTALNYLTEQPGSPAIPLSPINSLLQMGLTAFPGTARFGLRNTATGQVIAASNTGILNALNGNGLLEQTVLNHQLIRQREFGSDFGLRDELDIDDFTNSLTVGAMVYDNHSTNDQSATTTLINDVTNGSNIYDVVALNGSGGVLGSLTNNGLVSYGDWGNGINHNHISSQSLYANDEFTFEHDLHIDLGLRYEHEQNIVETGNSFPNSLPVPAGLPGLAPNIGNVFNGTFTKSSRLLNILSYTAGVNYQIFPELSAYVRYFFGNQTPGGNNVNSQTKVTLYEGGFRWAGEGLAASLIGFRTIFNNQNYAYLDPNNPGINGSFLANSTTDGFDFSGEYRPEWEPLHAFDFSFDVTYQTPTLSNVTINGVASPQYNGNVPQRTPQILAQFQPSYNLPDDLGSLYIRWKYVGSIYADSGDGLALPDYHVVTFGALINITPNVTFSASLDNAFNTLALTEGNPRQGNTQSIVNGYFYGRGIIGTNALFSLTYTF